MTKRRVSSSTPGVPVGWVLGGAAVLGVVVGVALAGRQGDELDVNQAAIQAKVEDIVPMGAPLPLSPWDEAVDPFAPDPQTLAGIPPYPHAKPRRLTQNLAAQGSPMSVSWASTQDSPAEVIAYYAEYYRLKKVLATSHMFNPNLGYVGWLEGGVHDAGAEGVLSGVMHTITAVWASHETILLLSATRPLEIFEGAKTVQLPPGMALPPRAARPTVLDLNDEGLERQNVVALVKDSSVDEVLGFYDKHFELGKWQVRERNVTAARSSITARRGTEEQVVIISNEQGKVTVSLMRENRPAGRREGLIP